jgi:hypothetical protein
MTKSDKITRYADEVISILKEKGFVIQRHDLYEDDLSRDKSVYLRLDYGVVGTIRISSKKGKEYVNHQYNIILNQKDPRFIIRNGNVFGEPRDLDGMIDWIIKERKDIYKRYGQYRYGYFVEKYKRLFKNESADYELVI